MTTTAMTKTTEAGGAAATDHGSVATRHLFDLVVELEQPRLDVGEGPLGRRFFDRVRSGRFDGPRLRGEVLAGSADPILYRRDGSAAIDARATLCTDDGAVILMTYSGRVVVPDDVRPALADLANRHEVDPSRYYIRALPVFETGAPAYQWLNGIVAIASGYLTPAGIGYRVVEVL